MDKPVDVVNSGNGEEQGKLNTGVKLLEEWMEKTDYMPKNYDKRILVTYFRCCKYNLEKAKKKLENFYVTKTAIPRLFMNPRANKESVDRAEHLLTLGSTKSLTPNGFRLNFVRFNSNNPSDYNFEDIARYFLFIVQLDQVRDLIKAGDIMIFDAINFVPGLMPILFHKLLKPIIQLAEEGLPTKIEEVHVINGNSLIVKIMNTLKHFVKEKNRDRAYVHTSHRPLLDLFPANLIPSNYDGTSAQSLEEMFFEIKSEIHSQAEYIRSQEEVLCSGVPKKYATVSLAGEEVLQGSFRKLEID